MLHTFGSGTDGADPEGTLVFDAAGNLYGTTTFGGTYGFGTVFELTVHKGVWTETVLHNFINNNIDGTYPPANLIFDSAGNLYGTTFLGGTYNYGTVFEMTPQRGGAWAETVLHNFNYDGTDGDNPHAGVIFDAAGNLYGTAGGGGAYNYGAVFELTPEPGGRWKEAILQSFDPNGTSGTAPLANLLVDTAGNLYGTTEGNGGTVFELTPQAGGGWINKVLHTFVSAHKDGYGPWSGLVSDAKGNLYGTTVSGGSKGVGTVFEITP